jgi:signal transduction histidine kinase
MDVTPVPADAGRKAAGRRVGGPLTAAGGRWRVVSLGVATASVVLLCAVQFFAVKESAARTRAVLEASLDLQLGELVNEARRDILEQASHITHSVGHRVIRNQDLPGIAETFARAHRRHPEVRDFVAVLFAPDDEAGAWRVLRYVRPMPSSPDAPEGIGALAEDPAVAAALREAWQAIPERGDNAVHAAWATLSRSEAVPRQLFFHPVYELDTLDRRADQRRVGLIVFTADVGRFPDAGYLARLVRRLESIAGRPGPIEPVVYRVHAAPPGEEGPTLVATGSAADPFRERGFPPQERIFPTLRFGVALRDGSLAGAALRHAWPSVWLGVSTALLALIGVGLSLRATARERRTAELRSDFLASFSHELKTPLTAIRAFGDLLRTGRVRDGEKVRQYGDLLVGESERLGALVNNILEVSRLERRLRRFRIEPRELGGLARRTVELFRGAVAAQGFEIRLALPGRELVVPLDEGAVCQALLNFLSNAVRYSGESRRIDVAVLDRAGEAGVEVRDFGVGISGPEQRRIFDPFYRGPAPAGAAESVGTGLGLAIVREIARAHGGRVEVESELGAGASFRLWLPRAEGEATA